MKPLKIKSLWHGQIGVHQKYVKDALKAGVGMKFFFNREEMTIAKNDLRGAVKGISAEKFQDRFSGETYHLVYFTWKPDPKKQLKLL